MIGSVDAFIQPLEIRTKMTLQSNPSSVLLGIFLAAVSGIFFTLCSVMVKVLPEIDPSEVLLFRAIVQLALTIPIMTIVKASPLGPQVVVSVKDSVL